MDLEESKKQLTVCSRLESAARNGVLWRQLQGSAQEAFHWLVCTSLQRLSKKHKSGKWSLDWKVTPLVAGPIPPCWQHLLLGGVSGWQCRRIWSGDEELKMWTNCVTMRRNVVFWEALGLYKVSDVNRLQMSVEGHAYQFNLSESESVLRMDRDCFLQVANFGIAQDSRSTSALKEPFESLPACCQIRLVECNVVRLYD